MARKRGETRVPARHSVIDLFPDDAPYAHGPSALFLASSFAGPMPPPELVERYEAIMPGAAEFFFTSLERQSTHRQQLEMKVVEATISHEKVGMWLAFALAVLLTSCGTILIHEGKNPQGLSVIAATLVTLCGVFIYSRRREKKEVVGQGPAGGDD